MKEPNQLIEGKIYRLERYSLPASDRLTSVPLMTFGEEIS